MNTRPQPHTSSSDETRMILLQAAAQEFSERGFQAASLRNILARTGVTKGALYHHFPSKQALGYAVFDEMSQKVILNVAGRFEQTDNPIEVMRSIIHTQILDRHSAERASGSTVHHLAMEMASIDEGFGKRLDHLLHRLHSSIAGALRRAQDAGTLRQDFDPRGVAALFMASRTGLLGMTQYCPDDTIMQAAAQSLFQGMNLLTTPTAEATHTP